MQLTFHPLTSYRASELRPYLSMRNNRSCDSTLLDTYIWADFYEPSMALVEDEAALLCLNTRQGCFAMMPYCRERDLRRNFDRLRDYFHSVLQRPLRFGLADEESVRCLGLENDPGFLVREESDLKDYLYDAEALRTLSGKKYHKKLNLIHKFHRIYDGRWEYRAIGREDAEPAREFLARWYAGRESDATLEAERKGVLYVLDRIGRLDAEIGGIWIDGRLEAMAMGSMNETERMAIISVEKADGDVPGLYQLINQQFLLHAFPEAKLVNREDDMGLDGLRRAKESYHPVAFERKYSVEEIR